MAVERTYNVPLRKEWLKVPRYKRAKKAMIGLKTYLQKHMKTETVLIGPMLNEELWKDGIKNPPHHVKVTVSKDEKTGITKAELFGHKFVEKTKAEPKKKKAAGLAGKIQDKVEGLKGAKKTDEKKVKEEKTEEKKEAPKAEEKKPEPKKEEVKEVPKEEPKVEAKAEEKKAPEAPAEKKE